MQNYAIDLKNGLKCCDLVPRLLLNLKFLDKFSFDFCSEIIQTHKSCKTSVFCAGVFQLSMHPPDVVDPPFSINVKKKNNLIVLVLKRKESLGKKGILNGGAV